jgi:hypothetical protein
VAVKEAAQKAAIQSPGKSLVVGLGLIAANALIAIWEGANLKALGVLGAATKTDGVGSKAFLKGFNVCGHAHLRESE